MPINLSRCINCSLLLFCHFGPRLLLHSNSKLKATVLLTFPEVETVVFLLSSVVGNGEDRKYMGHWLLGILEKSNWSYFLKPNLIAIRLYPKKYKVIKMQSFREIRPTRICYMSSPEIDFLGKRLLCQIP